MYALVFTLSSGIQDKLDARTHTMEAGDYDALTSGTNHPKPHLDLAWQGYFVFFMLLGTFIIAVVRHSDQEEPFLRMTGMLLMFLLGVTMMHLLAWVVIVFLPYPLNLVGWAVAWSTFYEK